MSVTQPLVNSSMPRAGKQPVPNQLAVIAPLEIEGPITYQTLLEYLDAAPIPYQLWLLTPITADANAKPAMSSKPVASNELTRSNDRWSYSPEFSPVSGVDATPVAWPSTAAPRVITIQYEGLEINQAVNWAIRQAHGDMILVLDSGLSGLMQLRQALDEIGAAISANQPAEVVASEVETKVAANEVQPITAELPVPGAFNRRLVERLEQWGMALQRHASQAKERRQHSSVEAQPVAAQAHDSAAQEQTISRVDGESHIQPAKKLPKFITRFHEFI
jgi:hypothetical protein